MNRAYRIALVAGAAPLVAGVSIFLLWLLTRWPWLAVAGAITLVAGLFFFVVGMAALFRFCWGNPRTAFPPQHPDSWRALTCALLLIANFPVAGAILAAAWKIQTCYTVMVLNESKLALEDVQVSGGGAAAQFGVVPAGDAARRWIWFQNDGELEIRATTGGTAHTHIIEGYVCRGIGGNANVTWNPDGTVTVTHRE